MLSVNTTRIAAPDLLVPAPGPEETAPRSTHIPPISATATVMSQPSTAFHELYERYAPEVYRFALWLCGREEVAKDITSETFVRAWTSADKLRPATLKSYLFTIARHLHCRQWRRNARQESLDASHEAMPDPGISPDAALARSEEFDRTMAALQRLSELDRTLILLRAEQDLPYEEIAVITGLSVTAAKARVFRARTQLVHFLKSNPS